MSFDGTGDYLTVSSSPQYAFGNGDYTIECWLYSGSMANNGLIQISATAGGFSTSTANTIAFFVYNSQISAYVGGTAPYGLGPTMTANTWNHVALARSSGIAKMYINGSLVTAYGTAGAITDTTNYTGTYAVIGGYYSTTYTWNGYIDDLRVTNGIARYTANFTPPTQAFPNQ
jgi:hypothetical protein